jgi:hypothetical protein
MPSLFTSDQIEALRAPHVNRAWFVELDLPSGMVRYHSGIGTVSAGGRTWQGVSSPTGGRLVSIDTIEEPRFGTAAAIGLAIAGVDVAWFQSVKTAARSIEGRTAAVYFGMFDAETQEIIGPLVAVFPSGRMSAPSLQRSNGIRAVTLTIESIFSTRNYQPGGKWNSAGQKARYPGDLFFDLLTAKTQEIWK